MIKSKNETSHTYNKNLAEGIVSKIQNQYYKLFKDFQIKMTDLLSP